MAIFLVFAFAGFAQACITDSKSFSSDQRQHPTISEAILNPTVEKPDVKALTLDIQKIKAAPKTGDVAWWNELAGAYLRLNQPNDAVKILEPLTRRFPNDYGICANLGTAYHLQGRYVDAEKEIRRDLEINPNAHAGCEKYHLALLQYLSRDNDYQMRHVYLEEFTEPFLAGRIQFMRALPQPWVLAQHENVLADADRKKLEDKVHRLLQKTSGVRLSPDNRSDLLDLAMSDKAPGYLNKWDLGHDAKLDGAVISMASIYPREPACKVMLGMVALAHGDMHLAKAAFEQAIQLGSPQAPLLKAEIRRINQFNWRFLNFTNVTVVIIALLILYYLFSRWRGHRRKQLSAE